MKFLLLAGSPNSLINFRGHLLSALQASGLEVHAASPDLFPGSDIRRELESKGVKVHSVAMSRAGMNPLSDIKTLFSLWRLMRRIKPDYVLSYTIKPVIYGSLAAYISRVPQRYALITGLGYAFVEQQGSRKHRWVRKLVESLYRTALRHNHKVFFQNPDDESLFKEQGILNKKTPAVVVNGSGVDTQYFASSTLPEKPNFLLIARLLIDKGIREYAEAAYMLKAKYPQATFSLVGDLDENPNTISQQELDTWVQDGKINYLGRLKDVRPAIASSSVFVLPTFYREGVPRTILEALSMGRAVVTTDTPGCRETVVDGHNGYLVPVKDASALANAMQKLIEQPKLIIEMGRSSRVIAEEKYDVHKVNHCMMREMGIS